MMNEYDDGYYKLKERAEKAFGSREITEKIDKAYNIAKSLHTEQKRRSGEPYIMHPVAVANILLDLGMDDSSVVAALLHDTVEDTSYTIENVRKEFGEDVALLVDGVTKLGRVPLFTKEEEQAENIRKMLIAMAKDIRVIIIKLADRIHNMRTLQFMPQHKRLDKSRETLGIYAPIAHRLGIRPIKEELEDLAISFLDPVAYSEIGEKLSAQSNSRQEFLDGIINKIRARVGDAIKVVRVEGRIKSVHGIYRKMYINGKAFDEIYDIYAVRIIVDNLADCYTALGIIHDMYRSIPGRFKDYISTPKPNMYQSLHTTVIGNEGIPFEVQIRTVDMHHMAEYGIAAHWKYKIGKTGNDNFDKRLSWVRQLLESQTDADTPEDVVQTIKSDLAPEEVFVFTPKGDVVNLPTGATVIDFAYAIHSEVGNRMQGAKVDGRIVSIDYKVKNGEIIDILTSSNPGKGPSRDWLKIVRTSEARNKIRTWFKRECREENIARGKSEVEREFRRNFIRLESDDLQKFLEKIAEQQRMKSVDDFFAAIGYGGISILRIMPRIRDEYTKLVKTNTVSDFTVAPVKKQVSNKEGVIVEGIDNCLIKFSRCCNPLPGDDIIGFITRGHGVSIHKRDCTNVPRSVETASEPYRWLNAYWDKNVRKDFKSTVLLTCIDRVGLVADVTSLLANMHVMIQDINTRSEKSGRYSITITISVNGTEHLKNVIGKLEKINGVVEIERTGM